MEIEVVGEKVYVHHPMGATVARLCKVSGEVAETLEAVTTGEGKVITVPGETFSDWCRRVYAAWQVVVPVKYQPAWDRRKSDG